MVNFEGAEKQNIIVAESVPWQTGLRALSSQVSGDFLCMQDVKKGWGTGTESLSFVYWPALPCI